MAIIKCKMCGGELELVAGKAIAQCESCGTLQTIPAMDDERKLAQFERAELARRQCEFDKAIGIYEAIVADFPEEAEAYWGLVLCKFGIEYVDDPASGKKIPTCHRSSFDSVLEDGDYLNALKCADALSQLIYQQEATKIEEIRKDILEISSKEAPYDIFICYKETDERGNRTYDSKRAQDIYDALTEKGYRVFFSRITLEDKLGQKYEPCIFAALNSAKIMLVVGTKPEHFHAVWVKNEWSRYLKLMAKDKTKSLFPCFEGISPYDMPKELQLQAQDLGKIGALQDLLRGIEKVIPKGKVVHMADVQKNEQLQTLLDRGRLALEDGDWDQAKGFFEAVLNRDARNAEAYLGELMVELKVNREEDIGRSRQPLDDNKHYEKILRFGDAAIQERVTRYNQQIRNRLTNIQILKSKKQEVYKAINHAENQLENQAQVCNQKQEKVNEARKRVDALRVQAERTAAQARSSGTTPGGVKARIIVYTILTTVAFIVANAVLNGSIGFLEIIIGFGVMDLLASGTLAFETNESKSGNFVVTVVVAVIGVIVQALLFIVLGIVGGFLLSGTAYVILGVVLCYWPLLIPVWHILRNVRILFRVKKSKKEAQQEASQAMAAYRQALTSNPELLAAEAELRQAEAYSANLLDASKRHIAQVYQNYVAEAERLGLTADYIIPTKFALEDIDQL